MNRFMIRALIAGAVFAAPPAFAQGALPTTGSSTTTQLNGVITDNNWQAMCLQVTGGSGRDLSLGTHAGRGCTGLFSAANTWNASAVGGWGNGLPAGAKWLTTPWGVEDNNPSLNPGINNENQNWFYTYRVSLGSLPVNTIRGNITIGTFKLDNYWMGWQVGGADLLSGINSTTGLFNVDFLTCTTGGSSSCGFPGGYWQDVHQLSTGDFDLTGGDGHYLYLAVTGNGRTDGIYANPFLSITERSVQVPEPGSAALLLAGVAGLGVMMRRRRTA